MLRSPGTGVPASDERPRGHGELNLRPLEEQPVFLMVESPLCLMPFKTFSVFTYLRHVTLPPL